MPDETTPEATPAAPPPAAPAFDPEQFQKVLLGQMDERVKGFQRLVADRDEEIRALKTATLSEDEREQLAISEEQERIAALEAENELLRLSGDYPEEVSLFERILAAETAKDQLDLLREIRASVKAAEATPEPETQVADTDPNNPAANPPEAGVTMPDGTVMTNSLADQILKAFSKPGR